MKLKPCSKEEFEAFLRGYPRPLERDVYGACEPPLVSYNDWTLGNWPTSIVASHSLDPDGDRNWSIAPATPAEPGKP
jgi:hypothetical protein